MIELKNFFFESDIPWEDLGKGVKRRILAHSAELMIVEVAFEEGAVGEIHSHPHEQTSYVVEGEFEFNVDGVKKVLKTGDSTYKQPGIMHGGVAIKKSRLLDIFTPAREDFLK